MHLSFFQDASASLYAHLLPFRRRIEWERFQRYDDHGKMIILDKYLIKNGTVMSVLDETCRKAAILVENGIVTKIAENIEAERAEFFDAEGMYVSTGWLDSHCHFADYALGKGSDPVDALLKQGVTYALDLGSVGPDNYEEARRMLRYTTDLRYMSYLNIAHRHRRCSESYGFCLPSGYHSRTGH